MSYNLPMWSVEKPLGSGETADIYLAVTPSRERVALKVLKRVEPALVALLEREILLLAKLRHPHIVSILGCEGRSVGIFGEERGPCYWMEYVEGENLLEAAKQATPEKILAWFRQALEALRYLHGQGVLHGDLSPHNLKIDRHGRLKLLDFGLAAALGRTETPDGATIPYMAPERLGGLHRPASDLFSLGVVFYEAIAGRHPRAGAKDISEMMTTRVPSLLKTAPQWADKQAVAARLIDSMIEGEISRRPAAADPVLEALLGVGSEGGGHKTNEIAADYHSLTFWGAEGHLKTLQDAITHLPERASILAVHGATGTGKKRFLREAALRCALAGVPLIESRDGRFEAALEDHTTPKAVVFRGLESLSLADLTRLIALRRRGFPERGLLLLLEWNDDGADDVLRVFFEKLLQWPEVSGISLKNLSPRDSEALLRGAMGASFSKKTGAELLRQTGGNPRLLLEAASRRRGKGADEDFESLGNWRDLLVSKIMTLTGPERDVAGLIASAYGPVAYGDLCRLFSETDLSPVLHGLVNRELIAFDPQTSTYRPAMSLLTQVLEDVLEPSATDSHHRRWRDFLKNRRHPDIERLHHDIALKDEAGVIAGMRPVADLLWSQERKKELLAFLERALPVVADRVERARLFKEKMNVEADLGQDADALKSAERWFELGPDNDALPLKTVKYWFATGLHYRNLGRNEDAVERLKRCLENGDENDADQKPFLARAHSLLGLLDFETGRRESAKGRLEHARRLTGATGRRAAEIARHLAEIASTDGNREETHRLIVEARRLYENDGFAQGVFAARLQEGNFALAADSPKIAEDAYAEAEKIALALDNDLLLAQVRHNRSVLLRQTRRPGDALPLLDEAREVFEMLGDRTSLAECLKNIAITQAELGRFSEAEKTLSELHTLAKTSPLITPLIAPGEKVLKELRDGENSRWTDAETAQAALQGIYDRLPPALKTHFVERNDWQLYCERKSMEPINTTPAVFDWEPVLVKLSELNRELLRESDTDIVLRRLMDSAMEIAKAQHGFLLLTSETPDAESPIPGFTLVVARNLNRETLKSPQGSLSLSVVHRAMETGEIVATDNALQDARFRDAKSVHLGQLKSILALPVHGSQGVLGVFYLDHPLKDGLFQGDLLRALRFFSELASLALQKGHMIDSLKKRNEDLTERVDEQSIQMQRLEKEVQASRLTLKNEYSDIVGRSPKMAQALAVVDKITDSKVPVWIFGESGTGKEAIARALHFNSARKNQPFVTENCSALPESLLESELFGHKKGAFTHATADKKGLLHYADKGTVFLDEIADMSLNLQAKFLRFLQEGEIRPIGSTQVLKVDVRVVSASNKDLRKMAAEGKFREDLFFRLNGITVKLPPLRERLEDLPLLADHFLKGKATIEPAALKLLMSYSWPGNVRELQQTLETAALFAENNVITKQALEFKEALFGGLSTPNSQAASSSEGAGKPLTPDLERILRAIRDQCYQKAKAAKALGMSRRHLYTKLEQYGVSPESVSLRAFIEKSLGSA